LDPEDFCGNISNHPTYGLAYQAAVDNNPDDSTFGGITDSGSRIVQLGLRLFF
jgi:hypothetical protein